jgi:hypothetical protein
MALRRREASVVISVMDMIGIGLMGAGETGDGDGDIGSSSLDESEQADDGDERGMELGMVGAGEGVVLGGRDST